MGNYLVSVVIPTKNRYATLFPLMETLKKICIEHSELEIIVHDNSDDNNEAISFFRDLNCGNIKYAYCSDWLSVGDNSDRAILLSSGEYVSFIGDDDAIVPEIIKVACWMKNNNIDSCGCDYSLYRWPAALLNGNNSFEYKTSNGICREIDCIDEIKSIMQNGIQAKKNLPGVYHGLVKRSTLNLIFEKAGTFFPGPSPDMANAFALSLLVKKHVVTSIPFVVDGYSKESTGHLTEVKAHIGRLEDQLFLPKDTVDNWTELIPKIWLPNTIWPESAIQALKRCGGKEYIKYFNYAAMYVKIVVLYPQCRPVINEYRKKYVSITKYAYAYLVVAKKFLMNKIRDHRENFSTNSVIEKEPITISDAIAMTSSIICGNKMIKALGKSKKLED